MFMDSILHFENETYIGRTHFSPALLRYAVQAAAQRVEGVDRLKTDLYFCLKHLFRNTAGGVAIRKVSYNAIIIEICLVANLNYSSADLSYRVQEAVLNAAQNKNLTDKKIRRVDIRICDVVAPAILPQPAKS